MLYFPPCTIDSLHSLRLPNSLRTYNNVTCIRDWTGLGLVIGFINRLQVATTITYNTVSDLHNLQILHYNLLSLFPLVFTIRFLATDLNTGIITDSHFKYHCIKSLLITINTALPLFLHFMFHSYTHTHTSPFLVMQLKRRK
jgi:hypothetical protein